MAAASHLVVRIVECSGLLRENDDSRKIDPFVEMTFIAGAKKEKIKTHVKTHTADPLFNESFYFDVSSLNENESMSLVVDVYSRNWRSANELLGGCAIQVSRLPQHDETMQGWYTLFPDGDDDTVMGKILLVITQVPNQKTEPEFRFDKLPHTNDLNIWIGTFNCGNEEPPENLEVWFPIIQENKLGTVRLSDGVEEEVDLFVLGCQECEWGGECEKIWIETLDNYLGKGYKHVAHLSLVEMRIFIFCKKEIFEDISRVCRDKEATGLGHVYGNKGGVCISFDFKGTSFCFINSHLAAHQGEKQRRDEDYSEIVDNVRLGSHKQELLAEFDYVFWMGDLNYRVDFGNQTEKKPPGSVFDVMKQLIAEKRYDILQGFDQLTNSIRGSASFLKFQEAPLDFAPTFKVEKGADFTYMKKRSPAWCDRILWRPMGDCQVTCKMYDCFPDILTSDHKPVGGFYSCNVWQKPPGIPNNPPKAVKMEFQNVRASELIASDVMTGYSDPYIHFPRQELLDTFVQSGFVAKTVDPEFKDHQIPVLNFIRTNEAYLEKSFLRFQIRDYDRLSSDDTTAYGALPLMPFLSSPDQFIPFRVELVLTGKPAGVLAGEAKLQIERGRH